jgi:hypothetical protein
MTANVIEQATSAWPSSIREEFEANQLNGQFGTRLAGCLLFRPQAGSHIATPCRRPRECQHPWSGPKSDPVGFRTVDAPKDVPRQVEEKPLSWNGRGLADRCRCRSPPWVIFYGFSGGRLASRCPLLPRKRRTGLGQERCVWPGARGLDPIPRIAGARAYPDRPHPASEAPVVAKPSAKAIPLWPQREATPSISPKSNPAPPRRDGDF